MSRSLTTMKQAWQEWDSGIGGSSSIRAMDELYGSNRRASTKERKFYSNRKVLIQEIESLVNTTGITHQEAVDRLEIQRGNKSLDALMKMVKSRNRGADTRIDGEQHDRIRERPAKRIRR